MRECCDGHLQHTAVNSSLQSTYSPPPPPKKKIVHSPYSHPSFPSHLPCIKCSQKMQHNSPGSIITHLTHLPWIHYNTPQQFRCSSMLDSFLSSSPGSWLLQSASHQHWWPCSHRSSQRDQSCTPGDPAQGHMLSQSCLQTYVQVSAHGMPTRSPTYCTQEASSQPSGYGPVLNQQSSCRACQWVSRSHRCIGTQQPLALPLLLESDHQLEEYGDNSIHCLLALVAGRLTNHPRDNTPNVL